MNILRILKPDRKTIGFFFILGTVASLMPAHLEATSKISWEESHGLPLTFLGLSICHGVCNPPRFALDGFDLVALIGDILVWFVLARIIAYFVPNLLHMGGAKTSFTENK